MQMKVSSSTTFAEMYQFSRSHSKDFYEQCLGLSYHGKHIPDAHIPIGSSQNCGVTRQADVEFGPRFEGEMLWEMFQDVQEMFQDTQGISVMLLAHACYHDPTKVKCDAAMAKIAPNGQLHFAHLGLSTLSGKLEMRCLPPSIKDLSVFGRKFTKLDLRGLDQVFQKHLEKLNVRSNSLKQIDLKQLQFTRLQTLDLSANFELKKIDLTQLKSSSLKELNLRNTKTKQFDIKWKELAQLRVNRDVRLDTIEVSTQDGDTVTHRWNAEKSAYLTEDFDHN